MPRNEYPYEIREQAEALFVEDGQTYEAVAKATGVGITTLKIWGKQGGWVQLRRQRRENRRQLSEHLETLRVAMMKKAATSEDPQAVYAAVRLEKLALDKQRARQRDRGEQVVDIDRPKLFLEDMEFMAAYLKDNDPEALKVLARNFDGLINHFKQSHEQGALA